MSDRSPMVTSAKLLTIGMVLYPDFTLLDLAGPHAALGLQGKTLLLWKSMNPVMTDTGVSRNPTTIFVDCPDDLDVLFVPRGYGTNAAMQDEEVVSFLARSGRTARFVTSVCSGSLRLDMAGLLGGFRAANHWACYGALAKSGAIRVHSRVVIDRNRMTGGVAAGIDFGLKLLATLLDERTAKTTQLILEYDPRPPFDAGTPDSAGAEVTPAARLLLGSMDAEMIATLRSRSTSASVRCAVARRPGTRV